MVKVVFTHFGPHFEEIMAFLLFILRGGKKYPHIANVDFRFLTDANEIPFLPKDVKFSECIFLGIGKNLTKDLIAAGVPKDQIIDEHEGSGREEDSSFRKLLKLLNLEDKNFVLWADALGQKDSGKGSENFTVYRTLAAIYSVEMENECSCSESVDWAMKLARAAMERDDYFAKGERTVLAGKFFERLACAWACYRSGELDQQGVLRSFFFPGWQKCSADFPQTLRKLKKDGVKTLSEIVRMAKNGGQSSLNPLGLPRLLYALHEKEGIDETIAAAFLALDAEKKKQDNFFLALEEVEKGKRIPLSINGEIFALFVCSNNDQINSAARAHFGEEVGIVVQEHFSPKRSIQIFTNGRTGISLNTIYLEIMNEETRQEVSLQKTPKKKWHFLSGYSDILLNGSKSYPGTCESYIDDRWLEENIPRLAEFHEQTKREAA